MLTTPLCYRALCAWIFALILATQVLRAAPTADGLYAEVQTSEGTFYAQLHYDIVPLTVANFVGLATGAQSWVDPASGKVSNEPFYNGLLIPRAEPGFVIQMGSPINTLTGGPGYRFSDEFHPDLVHDAAGMLSMANSGPNTNSSQFFITLGATSHLDWRHAIFGTIVEGMAVVTNIGDRPAGTVTIHTITILRIGAAATAFDATAWRLPVVREVAIDKLTVDTATVSYGLDFDRTTFSEFEIYHSNDLQTWELIRAASLTHTSEAPPTTHDVSSVSTGESRKFFRAAVANYTNAPDDLNGLTINLDLTSGSGLLSLSFTDEPRPLVDYLSPSGTYTLGASNGGIGAYLWDLALPRGQLIVALENLDVFYFYLKFHPDGTGTFTARTSSSTSGNYPLYGNLTWGVTP